MEWWKTDWAKAIFLVAGLYLFWQLYNVFFLVFGAMLVGITFTALIRYVQRTLDIRWGVAAGLTYGTLLVLITIGGYLLIPSLASQYQSFVAGFPSAVERLEAKLVSWGVQIPDDFFNPQTYKFLNMSSFAAASSTISTTFGVIVDALFIFVLGLYFAINPTVYTSILKEVVAEDFVDQAYQSLQWWLVSRFVSMSIIGVGTAIGLYLLDMPFAIMLGLLAGLLSFIPNLGPILSFIPAGIVAAIVDIELFISVLILYVGVQLVETYIITPIVNKQTIAMPPGVNLTAQIFFGAAFGFFGLLFAVPLALLGEILYTSVSGKT